MKSANIFDVLVVIAYFVFMLGIGIYFVRVNKGGKQYFTGGSMIPWWMSGMTLYMANFSAYTFTGLAGMAYTTGWFTILYFFGSPIAYFVGTQMTAARWRRSRSISPVEYTYTRYNISTQQLISWVTSTSYILAGGVQLASTCILLAPILGADINTVIISLGIIILLYTFLGGVWAVSMTDVVQGVILLSITFIVLPLSLGLVGGFGNLVRHLPAISFSNVYNGVRYDMHYLISILVITTIGFAGGQGQRFYSVKDERDAKRVGRFAGILALTIPTVFGIPFLVTRVLWPDLSQVEFFKPYLGNNPQNLVYVALCLKLLPNGLIGVFIAAMLAATMSTLSSVYNMVSSIFARDVYQGVFKPDLTDVQLLNVGRIISICVGLIVIYLALTFVNSHYGIFNYMNQFFVLFNIPVTVPLAFGLIFRRVPRWSAIAAIVWGLLAGATAKFVLGWDLGVQAYFAIGMTLLVYTTSRFTGNLHRERRGILIMVCAWVTIALAYFFQATSASMSASWTHVLQIPIAVVFGSTLYLFAKMFSESSVEQDENVQAFFHRLDTSVDVAAEVYGAGKKQISTMPFVGMTTIIMGLLMTLIFLSPLSPTDRVSVSIMICIMILFGLGMWFAGKRVARQNAGK